MKFVITHVKNESYLLKWWLPHHRNKFDHGIVIDYNSTDNTVDLVRQFCPTWEVIQSRNANFDSKKCDAEVTDIQHIVYKKYPNAWCLALCATEFLIGDTKKLDQRSDDPTVECIPVDNMVDSMDHVFVEPDPEISLVKQRTHGVPLEYNDNTRNSPMRAALYSAAAEKKVYIDPRGMRIMHNYPVDYLKIVGSGRHAWTPNGHSEDFRILWYGNSPFTQEGLKRKLAVQTAMSDEDKNIRAGFQHLCNKLDLFKRLVAFHEFGVQDMSETINRYENY